ncbi:MAG: DUF86 domain-containing protein [Rubrivivax sp.]|nr:DUF86 domain-containing protein [Rubrivivax sp.]
MSDRLHKHLHDALTAARRAVEYLGGATLQAYGASGLTRSAVERQLEILGEACRRALEERPELRRSMPETALAVALRNRLIHGYDGVDDAIVHDTVVKDLPTLIDALARELHKG